ncbi:MAG TPA: DUF3108 domain-containing protein [Methylibium sp.]|uniref:DUF3108 domain-containing protein n=1 Tax=Methylibium sp. TaxID=2067992 RepID=UPI002DBB9E4C|nr:DUF3108 domain-containing protein [Methylibium sp.]HEU4460359.1 DUF3108 domain-containing protein [Methylibium sp.]
MKARLIGIAACVVLLHAGLIGQFELPQAPSFERPASAQAATVRLAQVQAEPKVKEAQTAPVAVEPKAPRPSPPPRRVLARSAGFEERPPMIEAGHAVAAFEPLVVAHASAVQTHEARSGSDEPADVLLAQAPAAPPAAPALPTYRAKPPAAATIAYRLTRGAIVGSGEIAWQPEGNAYRLQLEGRVPIVGTLITQASRGRLDASGLVPERFTDKRIRRGELAANFDRAAGTISFSGQQSEVPFTPGVQDRVSVMIHLAAIANAWRATPPAGEVFRLRVVGARGDARVWALRFEGMQAIETPDGRIDALHMLRQPEEEHDTRAEFWLDPNRQFLPVKVVLTDGKGESLELLRMR